MTDSFKFDDKTSRALDVLYLAPMSALRRQKVRTLLDLCPGEAVLDIGTGPGYLAEEMAAQVGATGRVEAIDRSPQMLALAQRRCAGLSQVGLCEADVLKIPFSDSAFDAAACVQVYEFVEEIQAALWELKRVLRPGGRAVIVDTDWASLVWEAEDRGRAEKILSAWDEHLADPYLPRRLARLLTDCGFDVRVVEPYTVTSLGSEPFPAGLAKMIAEFVPGRRGITAEDATAWLADLAALHASGRYFFSVSAFLFLATRRAEE
ncbi:MAG: methyltransferase domain-containing protein [Terracidiphilus sp.]